MRITPCLTNTGRGVGSRAITAGYSLIELMVTMLIGLIILNGVFQIVIASKRSSIDHQEISYIQENARFALDIISRDVRMAGYLGCANRNTQQVNVITHDVMGFIGTAGIVGFDHESGTQKFPTQYRALVKDKTDSLMIRRGEYEQEFLVRAQNPSTQTISLWSNHSFDKDQPLAMVDASCRFSALFTAASLPAATEISHQTSGNNCSATLRGQYTCQQCSEGSCPNQLVHASYPAGSRVMPLISNAYFIGESTLLPGAPALKRQTLSVVAGALTTETEELATGIENIQLQYGVDINNDGQISEYRSAHQMDINGDGTIDNSDWQSVRTVKIELLLVSQSPAFTEPQTVKFAGIDYTGLFMRQVVSSTITIRNTHSQS